MSNHGDTPDQTPQDPYGQQPPPGQPGQPDYGQPAAPYGQPYGQPGGQAPYGQAPYGQPAGGGAPFSVGDAFGYGWNKFKANLGPIVVTALVLLAVLVTLQIIQWFVVGGDTSIEIDPDTGRVERTDEGLLGGSLIANLFFGMLSFLAQLVIQSGIIKGALDLTKGRPLSLGSMFSGINWVQVFVASLIVAVATMIGFVLCILPGLAVMFLTAFSLYFIIDKGMSAIDGIRASVSFTVANAGTLIVFFLACLAAYVVGALLCGVGLLVAIPVVVLAQAYTYRTLQGEQVAA